MPELKDTGTIDIKVVMYDTVKSLDSNQLGKFVSFYLTNFPGAYNGDFNYGVFKNTFVDRLPSSQSNDRESGIERIVGYLNTNFSKIYNEKFQEQRINEIIRYHPELIDYLH